MMEDIKVKILDSFRPEIVEKLDPSDNVLQYLYEKEFITDVVFSRISENPIRAEQSRELVYEVKRKELFDEFIEALNYKKSHRKLAEKLVNKLRELSCCSTSRCRYPGKVDIMCGKMKKLSQLTIEFHILGDDGDSEAFESTLDKHMGKHDQDPDVMFRLLDEQAARMAMLNDYMDNPVDRMERLIPFSYNSEVAAMAFLTRKGSLCAGQKNIEQALQFLEKAKAKSSHMAPCFETGRVMYCYVDVLMDIYEINPSLLNKVSVINNIKETIEVHLANSEPELRDVFTRIFYLKLAFCYLGINFQGGFVLHEISQENWKAARFYIEKAENIPCPFNKRRYMFLLIAKSVLNYRAETPKMRRALQLAKEAHFLSDLYGFKKESPYISRFIVVLSEKMKILPQFQEEIDVNFGHVGCKRDTVSSGY